ncbi:hypothetical protein [Asanoa siamensis]|uniref:Uncharacterized protein n=1 Tax=Asanoa siamensis TaxID=926357 RepID=A0ABQ4CGZ4_9ACTN|nr:hypothetical protein [Asanoa siamensis]GIF70569.1 hypothetical protein Asi02nite_00870 [Asanoa siamensis]
MDARPLKDVLTDLVGDPSATAEALAGAGHDLPPDLVAEAVVSFAGSAPAEVAEHLAPFVTAHSGVPVDAEPGEPADWAALLATAPGTEADLDDAAPVGDDETPATEPLELAFGAGDDHTAGPDPDPDLDLDGSPDGDLDDEPVAAGGEPAYPEEPTPSAALYDDDADDEPDDLDDLDG